MTVERIARWAADNGIAILPLEAARTDYGRWIDRLPALVLGPRDEGQLSATMRVLAEARVPYTARGAGHSSGGQSLGPSVVLDLRGIDSVLADDPVGDEITVGGGISWRALIEHLAPQGRRPWTMTSTFEATVGGTIAVGGFGDTTHLRGLVTAGVTALRLVLPDGSIREVRAGDDLFEYSLAGRGQLGLVAAATLRTLHRPLGVAIRALIWDSLGDYIRDMLVVAQLELFELVRARMYRDRGRWVVHGLVGHFIDPAGPTGEVDIEPMRPAEMSEIGRIALLEHLHEGDWNPAFACPAVELTLPLPNAVDLWDRLGERLERSGLLPAVAKGMSVMLVPRQSAPLAPLPAGPYSLMIAIRPDVPLDQLREAVAAMRELTAIALENGARLYLMSVEPDPAVLRASLDGVIERWSRLKREVDPQGICLPGLLGAIVPA